ncbi:S60 ribosomal protein L35a [Heterostelium album PN500]|uniref:S60 ribosomal protein L35a n=1 Tax=Heterostelium pallidum (strain ATCC 26659 / Pp 5 / PN500) TaxID=670386 RepID=D3BUT5_HETP5|nr:S60 ribosomal protein L35a [Heterostelium album PN500]EFA74873.1 S60 ribosomal protein L35a [Heterostelium album PN500]|eukprot:XP_020427007.1 S60 ribosomal protein L35a [Heterostelium album PN500]
MSTKLHSTGVVLGYRRSKATQYPNISLVKIEGVATREDSTFYIGKRVCLARRVKKSPKNPSGHKLIWGKISKSHGSSGVVQARFPRNLPPKAMGAKVRVMLFPSAI